MQLPMKKLVTLFAMTAALTVLGKEYHVSVQGNDVNDGSKSKPFKTISAAALRAQPGDVITVHAGVYRERINPPRGGTSDKQRIIYQAGPGEKVVISGSEPVQGWEKVQGDTWKVTLPNAFFGRFNPYADLIHGDWFSPQGRPHHTGAVYLKGDCLVEAARLDEVLKPAGKTPLWYAQVDGASEDGPGYLLNIASFRVGALPAVPADQSAARHGTQLAPCSEGGKCVGYIRNNDWVRYDGVDFGAGADSVEFRAAAVAGAGGQIELHLGQADGELLGACEVAVTGDWQKWQSFTAKIKPTAGKQNLCLVFKWLPQPKVVVPAHSTVIYAQFPGLNPNEQPVEINVRQTVFTPDKTGIDYLTVRGFDLRNAAPPWAPPTAGQLGVVSAYWCKGWIIESNEISYSTCCGIALGKYSDEWDNRAESAEGYVGTLTRALTNGWNKATVGGHVVRNNHIHHCGQTGVVGSLGCSFSTVTGNVIHDIHLGQSFGGAEMAGIKFHGAIDVVISHNHIYRCGDAAGIWLDWMGQGGQVVGNLLHDNIGGCGDIFLEMQHGPLLMANNLLLSKRLSFALNSQGVAFAHNVIRGPIRNHRADTRLTPFHPAHSTQVAGLYPAANGDSGDHRFYNNLFVAPCNLQVMDTSALPCFAAGNVFTGGAQPSKFDTDALLKPDVAADLTLTEKPDGWYLDINLDPAWATEQAHQPVTTDLLGKASVPGAAYENPDGSPVLINTDYFGKKRSRTNPFPGPFELSGAGKQTLKVWPVSN
jgi:alpha-L-arabinofuranosidase